MNNLIAPLLSFLLLYKYLALFILTFSAAVILPIPMNTVLLATGAFASQGYFNFFTCSFLAILANIAGDCVGYILARIYGHKALKILHIKQPSYMERFEGYINTHSGITIFFTRFIGIFGSLVNLLAGFICIPFIVFLTYDFIGNVVSVGGVIFIGYFLGIHWEDFSGLFSIISWIIIGLIIMFFLLVAYRKYNSKK